MRTTTCLPLALLLAAVPALGQDLGGLYRVTGDLPGPGGAFEGVAALASSGAAGVRVQVEARTAEGRAVRLTGLGRRIGGRLEVRYRATAGLAGALDGAVSLEGLVGRHRPGPDGGLAGPLSVAGQSAGQARFVRAPLPEVAFVPGRVEGEGPLEARLRGEHLGFVTVRAPGKARVTGSGATRRVTLTDLPPGEHVVTAHVGTTRGPVVARLTVVVRGSVLDAVAARVGAVERPVVVFDLDDTLFETRTRSATILREFAAAHGEPRLAGARNEHVRFGIDDTLLAVGLTPAEVTGDLGRRVRRFWSPRFFEGSHLHHDTPLPGAVAYVRRLHDLGVHLVYLTGRKTSAGPATRSALEAAGFPVDGQTTLLLKPDPAPGEPRLETAEWKGLMARTTIAALGTVVGAFDNEPINCNALREHLPAATHVVFLDTLYKPDSPALLGGVVTLVDFE